MALRVELLTESNRDIRMTRSPDKKCFCKPLAAPAVAYEERLRP